VEINMTQDSIPSALFEREVSHQEALGAACDLIDHFFKNEPRKRGGVLISIPARADNTDLLLTDYIKQQWAKSASAMSAGTAETGTGSGLQPASAVPEADAPSQPPSKNKEE
jgi:hypothetical protein